MSLILKADKTYDDKTGISGSDFYAIVDTVGLDKIRERAEIHFSIYKDEEARGHKKKPLSRGHMIVDSDKYSDYFSIDLLIQNDIYEQAYKALMAESNYFTDWESDEK